MATPASQAHLDTLARQLGFHDYATYQGYQQHQAMMRQANPPSDMSGTAQGAPQGQPQGQPQNWLQHLLSSIPATPAYLLGKVNDAMGSH